MSGKSVVMLMVICLVFAMAQAALNNPAVMNADFEVPALDPGISTVGVTDWFDSVAYTYTKDEGDAAYPETPYGENWAEMGNGRWIYQQIGTYSENETYTITFLLGQPSSSDLVGLTVELLAGGDAGLAADQNVKRDDAAFNLEATVGATVIASSGPMNPFASGVAASQEISIELSTGTAGAGYSVGDPLWLLFYRPSVTGRGLVDNVAVMLSTNDPVAVNPTPGLSADHINPVASMTWDIQNTTAPTFDINIGTDESCSDVLVAHSTDSSQSYTPEAGFLDYETQYYWRVDVTDDGTEYPGSVWSFTTGGKAYGPDPASGSTADRSAGILSWSGDAFVTTYDVWFGEPGSLQFAGNYAATSVPFGDLAAAMWQSYVPSGNYQWRVDAKDDSGILMVTGDVWDVTFPNIEPVTIDDFNGYNQTSDLLANWSAAGGAVLAKHDFYGAMQFDYDTQSSPYQSEARLTFAAAQDWTAILLDTFAVTIYGFEANDSEALYCTLSDGATSATVYYPQADPTATEAWQSWHIPLSDFSDRGLNLASVISVAIGLGDGSTPGGVGSLYIDDLLLDLPGCIAAFQPRGDLNKDCSVTLDDLLILAGDWLLKDFTVNPATPNDSLLLARYEFDETSGSTAYDSTTNHYDASVQGGAWDASGHSGRCLELDNTAEVTIPAGVFSSVADELTIAMWVYGDAADYPVRVNQAFFAAGPVSGDEFDWDSAAWDIDSPGAYGGQWNHYAAVKSVATGIAAIYHNGILVGRTELAADAMEGALAGDSILSMAVDHAGAASTVKMDDLRIYGYALTQAEIVGLAGSAVVQPIEPIHTKSDLDDDGSVSLSDFASVSQKWLEQN